MVRNRVAMTVDENVSHDELASIRNYIPTAISAAGCLSEIHSELERRLEQPKLPRTI